MARTSLQLMAFGLALSLTACGEPTSADSFSSEAKLQRANAQLRLGQAADARGSFEAVLELDPGNTEARLGLAQSALRLGESEVAERAFEEVLGLGGDRSTLATALRGLAELRRTAGDASAAVELVSQADSLAEVSQSR